MKRPLTILLALALVLMTAACSGTTTGSGDSGAPSSNAVSPGSSEASTATTPGTAETPVGPNGQQYGGTLRIIATADSSLGFGQPWITAPTNPILLVPVAEALCLEATSGEIVPCLATDWEIDTENAEIRMNIRQGVKFHDGSELNAEVVEWNFKMSKEAGFLNTAITNVEARGEYEIAVVLDGYLNNILNILATHAFSLISKESYDKNGADYAAENPVGTGPFKFKEKTPGVSVSYVRNDDYWQEGKPYLDEVQYVQITDVMTQNAAIMATSSDAADILGAYTGEQISTLRDVPGLNVNLLPIGPVILMPSGMNEDSPMSKLEVRQALAWAIDRQAICDARGFGVFTPANQYIGEGYMGRLSDSEVKDYLGYDPEKAKELLSQAGYPDGFSTELIGTSSVDRDTVVAVQDMLAAIGITSEIAFPEAGAVTSLTQNGWEGIMFGQARSMASITTTYRRFIDPNFTYNVSVWRPTTDEFKELYVRSRSTPTMQNDIMLQLSKVVMDNMAVVPIYDTYEAYIIRDDIHDTGFTEWGAGTIWLPQEAWREAR